MFNVYKQNILFICNFKLHSTFRNITPVQLYCFYFIMSTVKFHHKYWSRWKPNWVLVCPYFYQVFCFVLLTPTITVGLQRDHRLVWVGFILVLKDSTLICQNIMKLSNKNIYFNIIHNFPLKNRRRSNRWNTNSVKWT